jgi:hypothetical protein
MRYQRRPVAVTRTYHTTDDHEVVVTTEHGAGTIRPKVTEVALTVIMVPEETRLRYELGTHSPETAADLAAWLLSDGPAELGELINEALS